MESIMNKTMGGFFLVLFLTLAPEGGAADMDTKGWKLAKDKDGIKVLLREVEGFSIKEFHATATMNTTVERLVALYLDSEKCSAWVPNCRRSRVENTGPLEFKLYRELRSPWPVKNRDYELRLQLSKNAETGEVLIRFQDIKDAGAEDGCCVRMSMFQGFWRFTPVPGNGVTVTYRNHFNPGGGFPAALVNAAVADMPMDKLTNMKKLVENGG
jgi:hypothetical protein